MSLNLDDYKTKKPVSGLNLNDFKTNEGGVLSKAGDIAKSIGKDIAGLAQKGIDAIAETKPIKEAAAGLEAERTSFGTHTARFLFDTSKSYFDKVTGALSNTKFIQEAAAGIDAMDRSEAKADTFDFLGEELAKNLSEFGKSFSGRGGANVIDTMVASPLNFATRSIYGKSNPLGDFFSDFANEMRSTFSTDKSRAVSEQTFSFDKVKSSDFWLTSVAENVPVTLAFMRAAMASHGATANLTKLFGTSKFATIAAETVNATVAGTTMRAFEGAGEAEETYKQAKQEGMSEKKAIEASRQVFADNMKLIGLDAAQVALALVPVKFGSGSVLGTILRETAALAGGAVSEGGEEVFQYGAQQRALGNTDLSSFQLAMTDPQAQEAGFIGAVMGVVFQAGGRIKEYGEEKIRIKYLDKVATKMGVEFTDAYSKLKTADEKQAFLDTVAQSREQDVKNAVQAVEEDHQKAVKATQEAFDTVRDTPQEAEIKTALESGKSPKEVALELSQKIGTEEALALVNDVVSRETATQAGEAAKTPEKKTTVEDTKTALSNITEKIDESVLDKNPAEIQADFDAVQNQFEESVADIRKDVADIKARLDKAPDRSALKKQLKVQLSKAQAKLNTAEDNFNTTLTDQATGLRTFLGDYIKKTYPQVSLTEKQLDDVIDDTIVQITDPTALIKTFKQPLKDVVSREMARTQKALETAKQEPEKKPTKTAKLDKQTPITEVNGEKVAQRTAKTIYKRGRVFKGTHNGKPLTTNTFLLEFKKVVGIEITEDTDITADAVKMVLDRLGDKVLPSPKEVATQRFGGSAQFLIFDIDEGVLALDIEYYNYLAKAYPTAVWKYNTSNNPVGLYEKNKPVAVVMPVNIARGEYKTLVELKPAEQKKTQKEQVEEFLNNEDVAKNITKKRVEEALDKSTGKEDDINNGKDTNSRGGDNKDGVPTPSQDSTDKSKGVGGAVELPSEVKRGKGGRPSKRGGKSGKRPSTRLTNEEVAERVAEVTRITPEGQVVITGEINEEMLEIAGQYKPAGVTKDGRGVLDEYYTNSQIVDVVKSLFNFPAGNIKVLEPAVGTGNFLYALPEAGNHTVVSHEINETTARIAKIFHQNAKVYTTSFEQNFIDERGNAKEFTADYDLVIGNPPYGEHRGKYLGLGEEKGITKYEDYFIKRGLDVLKDGGTLAMVVPSGFLNRGTSGAKSAIAEQGELIEAFRLPTGIFAGTEVGTDIVVFRKRPVGKDSIGRLATEARLKEMSDGNFFTKYPDNILGNQKQVRNRFGKMEDVVEGTLDDAVNLFYQNNNSREAIDLLTSLGVETTAENIEATEEAIDEAGDKAKELVKQAQKQGKKTIEKKIVKKATKKDTAVSLETQFEGQFGDREIQLWKDTQADGSLGLESFVGGYVAGEDVNSYNGKLYNDFNYLQGDIYEKLQRLELDRKKIGEEQYERQKAKLEAVLPARETLDDLKLSPNITFVKELKLGFDANTETDITLRSAFLKWLNDLPRQAFGDSSAWEVREYVNNEQVRGTDKDRNELIRTRRKIMADALFAKFTKEGLTDEQKQMVEDEYNRTFNFYHTPDYKKVPMFSNVYSTFKGRPFNLRDVQKHGIGRLVNTGVGILAHDVGFGKTISGILAISEVMHRGWAKKPIIVVPSENVYQQWINTIEELIPDAKLNLLGNLGVTYKGDLSTLEIPEGSISILTYEGFKRLGFNDETYDTLSSKFNYIADDLTKHKTERDREKAKTEAQASGGKMKKGTRTDLSFEDLGFDHITFDEVHNANHIVGKVKLEKGQASEFNRFSLRPSDLGLKTWLATQYIQSKNDGRNVNLLSATPFTNHPLEYYSILSLVADKSLSKMGMLNVNDFFGTFMEAESEYEFKADGTYQKKTDIRRFRNFRQFRKLLDTYIDFKEGDAEGIVRPNRVQQTYEIPQNDFGLEMEAQAQAIFKENERESGKGAKVLRAITELRKIAFSPFASQFSEDIGISDYKRFVEESPKIKALMALIAQNKKDKAEAGQLVYVDQVGVEFLPLMRQYLIKEVGYKEAEVEIISGATAKAKRITIQDNYNKGDVKIILGSEAIKEGMNLQENTTDLYILSLPWNFTQLRQVIGRAWRQGNAWKNVRINNLFIQDSVDIFLSQKLDNKQKRYESAIKSAENEVDVGDVSFDEMKFELIKDPETRAKLELQAEKEQLSQEITQQKAELAFATRKLEKINDIAESIAEDKKSLADEQARQEKRQAEGEDFENYWIDRYTNDIAKNTKTLQEEINKLKEKGIDTDTLLSKRTEGEKTIAELEAKEKELDENFDARVKEVAKSMPERKPFSQSIIDGLVSERAEHNKTFYELVSEEKNDTIVADTVEKPIKSSTGKKVVKTKKTTKVTRSEKVTPTKDTAVFNIMTDTALSVTEKVDKLLDVKQKGKEFKDVGDRVAGSKKERATIRSVIEQGGGEVFEEIVSRLGVESVLDVLDKNEILSDIAKPDPVADKEAGVPALIAFTKKDIYDKIQRRFSFRQGRGRYKDFVAWSQKEGSTGWSSVDTSNISHAIVAIKAYPELLQEFVTKLTAVKDAKSMADFWQSFRDDFTDRVIGKVGDVSIRIDRNVFGDAVKNYKAYVPSVYGTSVYARRAPVSYFDLTMDKEDKALFDKELNDPKWWDKAIKKGGKATEETELKHGNFKPLENIERNRTPISEEKIKPETLTTDYGFKSVQFGNYMDDATSKEHIRHTIGALEDIGEALDISVPAMIADTGLSMAYGARGGGGANAHFEPAKNIINLTKGRGDGSFFHEFVHYMDISLGGKYRGKWSSKKTRWYIGDLIDESAVKLMDAITGRHGRKVKEFTPKDDPYIRDSSPVLEWYKDDKPFEKAVEDAKKGDYYYSGNTQVFRHSPADLLQNVADIYRKPVSAEVDFWHEETDYYKGSKNYGGDYWSRPEELLARAGQAYIEDKMAEKGIKNNYVTRTTIAKEGSVASVYPQGEERKAINARFDALFDALRRKYPKDAEVKLKTQKDVVVPTYTVTEAGKYLSDLKQRLNLDFDVYFVDAILADKKVNPLTKKVVGRVEAYGATADNTIALVKEMAQYTAEHETVHLTLAHLEKIPAFRKQGLTREKVLTAQAEKMGVQLTKQNASRIEEQLALDFENYVAGKHSPEGLIKKFFILLKRALTRFAEAIGATKGDVVTNYFDVLFEGRDTDTEMVRLENKGVIESFIEEGVLDVEAIEVVLRNRIKPMEAERANKIADEIEANLDRSTRAQILDKLTDEEIQALAVSEAGARIWTALENDFAVILDYAMRDVTEEFKFKVKDEGDKYLQKVKAQYNDLITKQEQLENDTTAWKTDIEQELIRRENTAKVIEETPEDVKDLAKFTKRTPPKGELTERGIAEVETTQFENPQEAQEEITAYLKRKEELVQTRNKLRQLRKDIASAKREGKDTAKALRDIERRIKLRKQLLERKDFYVNMGFSRGAKNQMKMIRRRGRVVRNTQDFFMISDKKAKDIIANRKIHLMSEEEFNDFLIEFSNKAQELRKTLDARDEVKALIQERQYGKWENLQKAMGLPAVDKMTDEQANRFVEALSKYQFGDVFLTARQLETIHRTQWGEMKTERELLAKMKEHTGTGREELKTLTAPENGGYYTPWIKLARSHPFYNWLIGKRVEATVKAEREYIAIEEEVNSLVSKARSSRRKQLSLKGKVVELLVPTDEVVFGYIESTNKPEFAEKNKMTPEELALADYLITLYGGAYEYMSHEYGMKGRNNYMTHTRRSFFEALKESGAKSALREIFTSQREEEASFKILDEETGNTLAFEKFFGYAMRRTGGLVPSKNVARASLAYFRAFAKKKAMDEFIPEALIAVQAHKSVVGTTEKGLTKDPTFEKFVKRFLNDAKGRKVWFITKQGSTSDIALRAMTAWITIKYLGANVATAVANFIGDFTAIAWELSLKEIGTGIVRSANIPKAHEVNQQFRFFTGRNPIVELFDPQYNVPSRVLKSLMVLMSLASFQSNKFFLRSKMTAEEWQNGVVNDERLKDIALSLSRVKPNQFYVRSLAGNTTAGRTTFQFGTWAIAIFNTFTSDATEVLKTIKNKGTWEGLTSKEAQQLGKFAIMATLAYALLSLVEPPDDDDDSFFAQVMRKAHRELTTLTQALQFVTNPASYALVVKELSQWYTLVAQLLSQEKYKTDGIGYGIGDPKWTRTGERLITPTALKHFFPAQQEHTRDRLILEAVKSGEFDAEAIAEATNPDDWNNVDGERNEQEQKEYRERRVGEITKEYNFHRKYPESVVGQIILDESKNRVRVEKLIEYGNEVGIDTVYNELKELYKDRELCADQKGKTGCLVSDPLFKDFRKAKSLLDK